jgi:hypothetical protein
MLNGRQVNLIGPPAQNLTYYSLNALAKDPSIAGASDFTISIKPNIIETGNVYANATSSTSVSATLYLDPTDNCIKASYSDNILTAVLGIGGPAFGAQDYTSTQKLTWSTM